MGKKILTIILLSAVLVAVFYYSAGILYAQDSYKVNNGVQQTIDKHTVCKKVNNTSGKDVFVPVKTATEWAEFRIHAPSNISGLSLLACWACGDNVTFTYKGSSVTYGTVSSQGKCWLDRNLGASQKATAYSDSLAYGDLFQWGRLDDGHQTRTSGTTATLSTTNTPGHSKFIYGMGSPYDWRSPQSNTLWQGVSGTNNPCPTGWRIPTKAEWETEHLSWSQQNYLGAFASLLKLPSGGARSLANAVNFNVGSQGYYWSSNIDSTKAFYLHFHGDDQWPGIPDAVMKSFHRAYGHSVRCIQN